ncbi:HMG domain-containing protein 4 isoform X1 [Danaus plexippus]|uniref:HMG domain-containing protein 4 isoform X1 n=1 Tax=Danaus plexippus TaxID=13037 RepID=UPI002AB07325|nr:HMG domain-containing protein 4 isoform X1 [Danaus plexippus]
MQEDLEVTGVSRSGRVRKKSSKLMDFESPDDIETRFRRQTPVKTYSGVKQDETVELQEAPHRQEEGTASGSESDFYENNPDNGDSMESDSSASDEGSARTPANSLYMMEKSKKKLIVKDGRVVGRAKAQRKDKGKTRITAYMMWAKEARNDLLKKHPDMDFSAISKRLGELWANVNYNERYLWKRKAKRFAMQKDQSQGTTSKIISNPSIKTTPCSSRPVTKTPKPVTPPQQALVPVSAGSSYRAPSCSAAEVAAHLRLLGESLAIIGERLKEHEGQIAVSGSVSVLLDTLLCSLAPLVCVTRAIPAIAPPQALLRDTLHNIAYIMPGL